MQRNSQDAGGAGQAKPRQDLFSSFLAAASGTVGGHGFRVLMNRAAFHTDPRKVFADWPQYWRTGLGINLVRGTSSVTLQTWSKHTAQQYFGEHAWSGQFAGWLAPSLMGTTVATLLETTFIRKTLFKPGHGTMPLLRFSAPLTGSYFTRESGFIFYVMCSGNLPPYLYYPTYLAASWFSAVGHKFATWDATADIMEKEGIRTPNLKRDGFINTCRYIAHGNVYTHPSLAVPIRNPITTRQLAANFMYVTCHPNVLMFRMAFLGAFKLCYEFGIRSAPAVKRESALISNSLFNQTVREETPVPAPEHSGVNKRK